MIVFARIFKILVIILYESLVLPRENIQFHKGKDSILDYHKATSQTKIIL